MRGLPAAGLALLLAARAPSEEPSGCPRAASAAARAEARLVLEAAQRLLDAGRFEDALGSLNDAERLDPASPFPPYAMGAALLERRPADAVLAFTRCRERLRCLREGAPEARERMRAEIDTQIQALRQAVLEAERERLRKTAIPAQEANQGARPTLSQSLPAIALLEQRIADLQRMRQQPDREPPNLAVALGRAHFNTGALQEAEREFRAALVTDPGHGDAHNNLAVVLMLQGNVQEAEREMKAAEKSGVRVADRLKQEIKARKKAAASRDRP
jgi:tetratricopeptide (TPR) repeat protein